MSKVIFFFSGSGSSGVTYASRKESRNSAHFNSDVIRIYIKGCQEKRVGNGFLFPDLEIAANNIRRAFQGNQLNLLQLRENFGEGLHRICSSHLDDLVSVEHITLEGFSRGAVTTFVTARRLDDLNIPIHIIANQPVPGETGIIKNLYTQCYDLTQCRNIRSAYTFLSSHNEEQGIVHNYFFRQMVAKFPPSVNAQEILFPHQHHKDWLVNSPIPDHINHLMAKNSLVRPLDYETRIKSWYQASRDNYFTPHEFMQPIYGARAPFNKDPIYLRMLIEEAEIFLTQNNIPTQSPLNYQQAEAIKGLMALAMPSDEVKPLCYFLVEKTRLAGKFAQIIIKMTEICHYLSHVTRDNRSDKDKKIAQFAVAYKKVIFFQSFDLLRKKKPSIQDKKQFASAVYKAECEFRTQALGLERSRMHIILKLVANFLTHVTGIALVVNTVHKKHTGNWLLFKHNRSVNAVRNARKALQDTVDQEIYERKCLHSNASSMSV